MSKTLRHKSLAPAHPGAVILAGLEETEILREDLAKALGISRNTLYKLLSGKQTVTAEMAVRISKVWGGSPEMWLGMQNDFDLWHAQQMPELAKLKPLKKTAA